MAIAKFIFGFRNLQSGAEWTVMNWVDFDTPNDARAAADDWVGTYLALMPQTVEIAFAKWISNPLPGGIHTHVNFPVSSFTPHAGGIVGGQVYNDAMYMLGTGSGSFFGGESRWKFHGMDKSILDPDNSDKWLLTTDALTFQTACLAWMNQYRRVATPAWAGPGSRKRGYPVVSPPIHFPVFDLSTDIYDIKCGRSFALPGVVRH